MGRNNNNYQGDIFIRAEKKKRVIALPTVSPMAKTVLRTTGVLTTMAALFIGINVAGTTGLKVEEQFANPATPESLGTGGNGNVNVLNDTPTVSTNYRPVMLAAAGPSGTGFNTTAPTTSQPATTIQNHEPTDLGSLAGQIDGLNQQVYQNMQACLGLVAQANEQIAAMRAQHGEMQHAIDEINQQINAIPLGTPEGRAARAELQAQRDQINFQRQQINRAIADTRNAFTREKTACTQSVYRLQSQRRSLEAQLNNAYSRAVNVIVR